MAEKDLRIKLPTYTPDIGGPQHLVGLSGISNAIQLIEPSLSISLSILISQRTCLPRQGSDAFFTTALIPLSLR